MRELTSPYLPVVDKYVKNTGNKKFVFGLKDLNNENAKIYGGSLGIIEGTQQGYVDIWLSSCPRCAAWSPMRIEMWLMLQVYIGGA